MKTEEEAHFNWDIPCPTPTHRVTNNEDPSESWTFCSTCRDDEPLDDAHMMMRGEYGEKFYYTITKIEEG